MSEIFVDGNPRALSGGSESTYVNYEDDPKTLSAILPVFNTVTSATLAGDPCPTLAAAKNFGQTVHEGKTSYHNTPKYNVFLRDGEWPSAGVELETCLKRCDRDFAALAMGDLNSNWFHFERDGSLDPEHQGDYGYELITEPLPPRAYRSLELWTGLQNLCSPYLESFSRKETGLHVHVGLNQFHGFDGIPVREKSDRRGVGKLLASIVYYSVVDPSFLDRVVLRRATGYCDVTSVTDITDAAKLVRSGGATGAALVDYCVSVLGKRHQLAWRGRSTDFSKSAGMCWFGDEGLTSGHSAEINGSHSFTIEFRRAKGTLHALSVHRIVELMTSIVRFAGKLCREPGFVVTRDSFMEWLMRTTTSEALRSLIKQTKGY